MYRNVMIACSIQKHFLYTTALFSITVIPLQHGQLMNLNVIVPIWTKIPGTGLSYF